jgi:hypothetical protein
MDDCGATWPWSWTIASDYRINGELRALMEQQLEALGQMQTHREPVVPCPYSLYQTRESRLRIRRASLSAVLITASLPLPS